VRRFFLGLAAAALLSLGAPGGATAQPVPGQETPPPPAPPDSAAAIAPADSAATAAPADTSATLAPGALGIIHPDTLTAARRVRRDPFETDRFELGVATVKGPLGAIETFAYHRFLLERGPFEHSLHVEVSYGKSDYLTEGTASVAYLLRPTRSYRQEWRVRPIVEAGPAVHVTFQAADIVGFSDTAFHTRGFVKTEGYLGLEALLSRRWGVVVRGRMSVPDHRPLDYAQAAIFLR
jgi:hypothetical protein